MKDRTFEYIRRVFQDTYREKCLPFAAKYGDGIPTEYDVARSMATALTRLTGDSVDCDKTLTVTLHRKRQPRTGKPFCSDE